MKDRDKIKARIIEYCKKYDLAVPDFENYESVKAKCETINNYCRFCDKYKGAGMEVICPCEFS